MGFCEPVTQPLRVCEPDASHLGLSQICLIRGMLLKQLLAVAHTVHGVTRVAVPRRRISSVARAGAPCPLFEQTVALEVTGQELLAWRQKVRQQIKALPPSQQDPDTGPTVPELQRELDWLLDDACADPQWKLSLGAKGYELPMRCSTEQLDKLWHRRMVEREPLQYVVGCSHWMQYKVAVGPGVLIPRPETAVLIDAAAKAAEAQSWLRGGPWADLGTGSGALALGLADCLGPSSKVYAVDASQQACDWATLNVQRHAMHEQIEVVHSPWDCALAQHNGRLRGILSNPPYIPQAVMSTLQPEVLDHEPHLALLGHGDTGLEQLQSVCQAAGRLLAPGGFLGLETGGLDQVRELEELLCSGAQFTYVRQLADMFGVVRFVLARRA